MLVREEVDEWDLARACGAWRVNVGLSSERAGWRERRRAG